MVYASSGNSGYSDPYHGQPKAPLHFNFVHRAPKPDRPNADAQIHKADQWVLEKAGESKSRCRLALRALQLCENSPNTPSNTRNGRAIDRPFVGFAGTISRRRNSSVERVMDDFNLKAITILSQFSQYSKGRPCFHQR